MAPKAESPRRPPTGRRRGRPPGTTNAARLARELASTPATASPTRPSREAATPTLAQSESPPKRRRYIPGGAGGGGRFVLEDGTETPNTVVRRPREPREPRTLPDVVPRRERSARIRTAAEPEEMQYSSAAAAAAALAQSEGYKPREERGWEEFHPNLDIDRPLMIFGSEEVDGIVKSAPGTPIAPVAHRNGSHTPLKEVNPASTGNTPMPHPSSVVSGSNGLIETPQKRRVGRPPRDPAAFYGARETASAAPQPLPIRNQTPKERLDLKAPSFRRSNRVEMFESKSFGQARYVDKSMMNVGYQESDIFIRDERRLIKASDTYTDEDMNDQAPVPRADGEGTTYQPSSVGRVEYDMDEQDDAWLQMLNEERKQLDLDPVTREIFEITITKIEKEWHALEKRIPKPNPKPPQTQRPRSSSAAAVNGEPQPGEEQDSKCAICDDGDCENTNAIVFCDGCDLAVHQECYGVPFIPEGQWLCRKCQLIGRGVPTCIFCPNTDGAFKQTNSSKWAHLLCAMWIPEVTLGNQTFMEPVMDVDKVPKTRWKLSCYICNQRMGACIQCGNKSCYQAFHVTCARRAKLFLRMKNSHGSLAVLDNNIVLKAFCDKHCPNDYAEENNVGQATREAKKYYKRAMKGRIWAGNHEVASALAATHQHAITEHPPDESQMTGAKISSLIGDKKSLTGKPMWKLPSGAPVIPQYIFDLVESSLSRFPILKRKDYVGEVCRYWTLKREARRGAALLKRLQLQMESFSSMEITRRNFPAMGPVGKARLARRINFAEALVKDLEQLMELSNAIVEREQAKLEAAQLEHEFVDTCYFPVARLLLPIVEKAKALDKNVFRDGLASLQAKCEARFYTTTLAFAHDLCEVINVGINTEPKMSEPAPSSEASVSSPVKPIYQDPRHRKTLGKRILKAIQPQMEAALKTESEITSKPLDNLLKELDGMLEASIEFRQPSITVSQAEEITETSQDVIMVDASNEQITVASGDNGEKGVGGADLEDAMDIDAEGEDESNIEVNTSGLEKPSGRQSADVDDGKTSAKVDGPVVHGGESLDTPPATNGYVSIPRTAQQPAPPTPPQSNGSLGKDSADPLSEGGIPWYLKDFNPEGTTVTEEHWAGRDAVRSLSEDLTDMDDDELKGLQFDVEDSTIMASPGGGELTVPNKAKASKVRKRARTSGRRR